MNADEDITYKTGLHKSSGQSSEAVERLPIPADQTEQPTSRHKPLAVESLLGQRELPGGAPQTAEKATGHLAALR